MRRRGIPRWTANLMRLLALVAFVSTGPLQATAGKRFPSRPVTLIVPLPAGTSADIQSRIVAAELSERWWRPVLVENRPGAGMLLGLQAALHAPADGYTLLWAPAEIYTILPMADCSAAADPNRNLIPLVIPALDPLIVAATPGLGVATLPELSTVAKQTPRGIVIATSGPGTLSHLAGRIIVQASNGPISLAPHVMGGTNKALRDIAHGRAHAVIATMPALIDAIEASEINPLAPASKRRMEPPPEKRMAADARLASPVLTAFSVIAVAKGTPEPIVRELTEDLLEVLASPELRERFERAGSRPDPIYGPALERFIEAEQRLWWPIVKEMGAD